MSIDTIVYAVIALLLLARLWVVLGRRNEEDHERPNPFAVPPTPPQAAPRPGSMPSLPPSFRPLRSAPASLAGGLEQIKVLDASFDEKKFLAEAREDFALIVGAFAKGDLTPCTKKLAPSVLKQFQTAIEARQKAGQTMDVKVLAIKDAETTTAKTDSARALITVRFVSTQENVLRDAAGRVIGGEEGKPEETSDVWVFARDTSVASNDWVLAETGS
jgi:predicted lipid-binding transport protein (Tim44 family)